MTPDQAFESEALKSHSDSFTPGFNSESTKLRIDKQSNLY